MTASAALQESQINREETRMGICSRVNGGLTVGAQDDGRMDPEVNEHAGTTIRMRNGLS